jgi:zinc protease
LQDSGTQLVAVMLASIGLFGVVSYLVSERRRELAVRMALGADRMAIYWMILRGGSVITLFGCLAGLAVFAVGSQLLRSTLYQVSAFGPFILIVAPSGLACNCPARLLLAGTADDASGSNSRSALRMKVGAGSDSFAPKSPGLHSAVPIQVLGMRSRKPERSSVHRPGVIIFIQVPMMLSDKTRYKSLWISASFASLIFVAASSAQQARKPVPRTAPDSLPSENSVVASKTLANGLEVIVYEDHAVPLITIDYVVKAGSIVESANRNGLSHLHEHLTFKSNRATTKHEEYLKNIGELGISYNARTREELGEAYLTSTTIGFMTALRYMRDAICYPTFDPKEIEQEKEVVVGEIDRQDSDPYSALNHEMISHLFYQAPSRKEPIGSREVLRAANPESMRQIHAAYWIPNNSAIVVSGDITSAEAFRAVDSLFAAWERGPDPFAREPLPEFSPLQKSSATIVLEPIQNVVVELAWQGPSVGKDTPATYAADIFSFIVAQPNSRFQRNLVDKGLATAVGVGYYTQRDVGPISILMQTTPDKARGAVESLQNEIAHFSEPAYFTDEEFGNAKAAVISNELYDREKPSEYAHTVAFWWATTGTDYLNTYDRSVAETSRDDIQRYLRTYLLGKPHVGIAVLSKETQQEIQLKPPEVAGQ